MSLNLISKGKAYYTIRYIVTKNYNNKQRPVNFIFKVQSNFHKQTNFYVNKVGVI